MAGPVTCRLFADIRLAWWFGPVMAAMILVARIVRRASSDETIERLVRRAIRVEPRIERC